MSTLTNAAKLLCAAALIALTVAFSSCSEGSPSCGEKVAKASGGHWVCTFEDDFDGDDLDRSKWHVATTSTIGFTQSAGECYVDNPAHVRVDDGLLTLTATRSASPTQCGPVVSPYRSGMVYGKNLFAQAYGRFEIRAELPRGAGFQPALWMYPEDLVYGDRSGEIDIAEAFGVPNLVSPHIHVHDGAGIDHPQGTDCHVANASEAFHTYTLEWSPTELRFLYDDRSCFVIRGWDTGPPLVPPQPFDRPFFMLLQLGLGYGANAPSAAAPFPGVLKIDYVRAWK